MKSMDNKLKQIIVQLGASYEIAGRKLTDDTLLGYAQEIYNTIDIREDEVVPLFRKAREIADIPTMRILTDAYRIICKNRLVKNALPPPESECVSNEEFRNAFKQAKELVGGKKNV
jgi:hypothetical protein